MKETSGVRWLASDVIDVIPSAVPEPVLLSAQVTPDLRDYVRWWILHPDPAGGFARKTRWLRWIPARLLVRLLFAFGYDGLVFRTGEAIVGHVFFQRRGAATYVFSTAVSNAFEGRGFSVVMMLDCVAFASRVPGVEKVRIGTGRNNVARRLLQRLKKHEERLGWTVTLDGWVVFNGAAGAATPFSPSSSASRVPATVQTDRPRRSDRLRGAPGS